MTLPPISQLPARRLSKISLLSLVCGILGCVPFVTGALAVLFGLFGLIITRSPMRTGRWMAVIGLVLGLVSLIVWSGVGLMGGGIYALVRATEGPRIAAHAFLHEVSSGDDITAKADTVGMSNDDYDSAAKQIRDQGSFVDSTFTSTNISNDAGHVSGSAVFDKGGVRTTTGVSADLQRVAGHWRIKSIIVTP